MFYPPTLTSIPSELPGRPGSDIKYSDSGVLLQNVEVWGFLAPADIPSPTLFFFQLLIHPTPQGASCACTWALQAPTLSPTKGCFWATP